ncbi:hypothetical protein PMZ80_010713 [Knufia obscura]|uniref:Uncharacterized protein n=1 Tax=Knufia obscura TaxID=1635080 RepID=A0ABR0R9V2_9EURO|nr:hypothetical protein PMZ80_010713 [Knufia obscura]
MAGQKRTHKEAFEEMTFPDLSFPTGSGLTIDSTAQAYRTLLLLTAGAKKAINREYAERGYDEALQGLDGRKTYSDEITNLKAQVIHSQERLRQARNEVAAAEEEVAAAQKKAKEDVAEARKKFTNVNTQLALTESYLRQSEKLLQRSTAKNKSLEADVERTKEQITNATDTSTASSQAATILIDSLNEIMATAPTKGHVHTKLEKHMQMLEEVKVAIIVYQAERDEITEQYKNTEERIRLSKLPAPAARRQNPNDIPLGAHRMHGLPRKIG